MGASLDGPYQGLTPSSYGLPLQPTTRPGTYQVPSDQVTQFLRGFPTPPGAPQVIAIAERAAGQLGKQIAGVVDSGEAQRVLAAIGLAAANAAPNVLGGVGALLGVTGKVAGPVGLLIAGVPYVGEAAAAVLEVYAPLASVGGTTVTLVAQALAAARDASQAAMAVADNATA